MRGFNRSRARDRPLWSGQSINLAAARLRAKNFMNRLAGRRFKLEVSPDLACYWQPGVEVDEAFLQSLFDLMCDLAEAFV